MCSVLDLVTVDLGRTKTYAFREASWIPGAFRGCGHLAITTRKGERPGSRTDRDTYRVEADDAAPGSRAFLLESETDDAREQPYRVVIGRVPAWEKPCTCDAGRAKLACKHAAALVKLAADGAV